MGSHCINLGGLCISRENSKMGAVMHINLPPDKTCAHTNPCYCDGCYALKIRRLRPKVAAAQDRNWKALKKHRAKYFATIDSVIACYKPKLFRWHSAGDIPDLDYLEYMISVAEANKGTRFMCFTKAYKVLMEFERKTAMGLPKNLSMIASAWPGLEMPMDILARYPVAWMRDKRRGKTPDPRIPATAFECSDGCDKCQMCWGMRVGQSVVLDRH